MSSSSSVASDDSDGDAGLLSALLGPQSFGSAQHTAESSDFSYYRAVDSSAGLTQTGSPNTCSVSAIGSGGPVLVGNSTIGRRGFWS